MAKVLQPHVEKLREYLFQPNERNEDLALSYFRALYGDQFKRQNAAANADGYVAGHFVLELKGETSDWYCALFQGLAYRNKGLAFSLVVVAAKHFLALWRTEDIPEEILTEIANASGAPNAIGKRMASKFANKKKQLSRKATWYRPELFDPLFSENSEVFGAAITSFELTLKEKKRIRQPVTLKNFVDLSKFAMWLVKQKLPSLGCNYLVIDPACGSGNLVTNWRSPLELRHKVVSEIEPELLYAVEQRMKGDQWHNGKFTVVPKVTENIGLNFLDKSADEYVSILRKYLAEKGHKPDKPIAFLCNPPYRSDDDQAAESVTYEVDPAIVDLIGNDAASERYCCFLAQMKLICQAAADSGMPEDSILMLFTKAAWLTKRPVFEQVRRQILGSFEDIGGVLVNGKEFFDLKGKFPIAFTMWRYKGKDAKLDSDRSVPLVDLTHLTKKELKEFPWTDPARLDKVCNEVLNRKASITVHLGVDQEYIREWIGQTRFDFQREKTKAEKSDRNFLCGLPKGDSRHERKKTLGHSDGTIVGFMDDLTPCRIRKGKQGVPWFRLNAQFMDCRKIRCFSGPPDNRGYYAHDQESALRMFLWFSLGRTFAQCGYPMWVDALEMWVPEIPSSKAKLVGKLSFAISFAENECTETIFPAGNPIKNTVEVHVANPLSPLNPDSFWSKHMAFMFDGSGATIGDKLVGAVEEVFALWKKELRGKAEIIAEYQCSYFIGQGRLTVGAGLVQIKDYATEVDHAALLAAFEKVQMFLKQAKDTFYELLISEEGINYFGQSKQQVQTRKVLEFKPQTKFDHVIEKRIALAATLIDESKGDSKFGLTKFVKLFYLADAMNRMALKTDYYRQAAGPLDPRAIYHDKVGLLPLGMRHGYFETTKAGPLTKFVPKNNFKSAVKKAKQLLGDDLQRVRTLVKKFKNLDTDQSEIIATLFACWNDLLLDDKYVTDELIIREFLKNWHAGKTQFPKRRLLKALGWMREHQIVPKGTGQHTTVKIDVKIEVSALED